MLVENACQTVAAAAISRRTPVHTLTLPSRPCWGLNGVAVRLRFLAQLCPTIHFKDSGVYCDDYHSLFRPPAKIPDRLLFNNKDLSFTALEAGKSTTRGGQCGAGVSWPPAHTHFLRHLLL